jgi:hypothetical protein
MGRAGPRRGRRARRLGNEPPGRSWTSSARHLLCVRVPRSPDLLRLPEGREVHLRRTRPGTRAPPPRPRARRPRPRAPRRTRVARTSRATPARGRAETVEGERRA